MRKNKVGLIGIGIWGEKILDALVRLKVEVIVFDLRTDRNSSFQGVKFFSKFDSFLNEEVDGYIVASSTLSHKEVLVNLREKQRPIFIEKPLVNSFDDAMELKELSVQHAYMMHIWKYHPGIRLLSDLAKDKSMGKLLGVKSRRTNWTSPRTDTNSLWNLAIHDLSICESILGYIPTNKKVVAEKHNKIIRGAMVMMGDAPFYTFEVSNRYPEKNRDVRLFFEGGVALLKDEKVDYVSIYEGDDRSSAESLEERRVHFDKTPPLDLELREFVGFLNGGPEPMCPLEEGFRLVEHLFEIEKSC